MNYSESNNELFFFKVKKIVFLLLIILIGSCTKENKTEKTINDWIGKEMVLPEYGMIRNEKPEIGNPLSKELKVISFINGDCDACIEELLKWKSFMKDIGMHSVGFLFVIESNDHLSLFESFNKREIQLDYPYFFDEYNKINKLNKLPNEKIFRTFLIDSDNKVILMGNPAVHQKIRDLYIKEINKRVN